MVERNREVELDAVGLLSLDYKQDLDKLRSMSLAIVPPFRLSEIESMLIKYSIKHSSISKKNFMKYHGELSLKIQELLKELGVRYQLRFEQEKDPTKVPPIETLKGKKDNKKIEERWG